MSLCETVCMCVDACMCVYLQAGHLGWQDESHVVSMDHGEDTDGPGCDSPGVLESQLFLPRPFRILERDLKHLGEVLTKMVRCSTLRTHKGSFSTVQCLLSSKASTEITV